MKRIFTCPMQTVCFHFLINEVCLIDKVIVIDEVDIVVAAAQTRLRPL